MNMLVITSLSNIAEFMFNNPGKYMVTYYGWTNKHFDFLWHVSKDQFVKGLSQNGLYAHNRRSLLNIS
jgi:hypothetical protein